MENKRLDYVAACITLLNGFICIMYGEKLLPIVPIICGGTLVIKGIVKAIEGIKEKDYLSLERMDLENSFILIAVGIGILIRRNDALFIVGAFWGLHGLTKAAQYLNIASYNIFNKQKWILKLIRGITEFILSIILIFDPFGSIGHHIIFLGIELIFTGAMEISTQYKNYKKFLL
ncbi:DUF308 domain-containing protein [uncultured Clostridium sp.]|uniref:DUF308 domain-containing protein n=1 Tax=uncultured Clostridium sp. TaxID=59620 RepID=UPI002609B2BC|nr:DUF308 domain-containing protein [uncultured Clostridium sp.]